MAFRSESDLVSAMLESEAIRDLLDPENCPFVLTEPEGLFGVPDVVITTVDYKEQRWVCGTTSALEAKLRNWQRALRQAVRYRSFANAAYVVLDASHAQPAIKGINEFRRCNVGLITLDSAGTVDIHFIPDTRPPVCDRMAERMLQVALSYIDTP